MKFIEMSYGKERRKEIIKFLSESPDNKIWVNRTYCPLLKYDTDLVKLLKQGKLIRKRECRGSKRSKVTFLVLA